jgi:hypothetical protein
LQVDRRIIERQIEAIGLDQPNMRSLAEFSASNSSSISLTDGPVETLAPAHGDGAHIGVGLGERCSIVFETGNFSRYPQQLTHT